MILQAALNGGRTADEHPTIPITPEQIAAEVQRVLEVGANAVHFHVRQADGRQSLKPEDVSRTLSAVRATCPNMALGISTSQAIVPDIALRYQLVSEWTVLPDYVSVNIHEAGALVLMKLLFSKGIGVEAGVWTPAAVEKLRISGLGNDCLRILIEATEETLPEARANVKAIQTVLETAHLKPRCLLHGEGGSAWAIFEEAVAQGYDTRVGFEDMLTLPNGATVESNAELIQYAFDRIQAAEKKSR
ncbi:MAG: 3-keto-5-aminohexanoate cleavage protein [Anaerolineae bacterium]|nr:3-keto-5-aminohexanoate cleavage protein [Anaerolineae bacterium]